MKKKTISTLQISQILALALTALGFVLLIYMIVAEGEPGAIPLIFIVAGGSWSLWSQLRLKKQNN